MIKNSLKSLKAVEDCWRGNERIARKTEEERERESMDDISRRLCNCQDCVTPQDCGHHHFFLITTVCAHLRDTIVT